MVNFNLQGLENLEGIEGLEKIFQGDLGNAIAAFGALAVFIVIIFAILIVFCYVFGSIGLMNLAKKKNIPNPWLAFIPVGRSYIIGKLGHEIYNSDNKNATTFMWITLGLGAASFILGNGNGDLHTLVEYGLLFFESWAFYNMFKALNPKNSIVYTVFTVLTGTLLGGIFLYLMKTTDEEVVENATIIEEKHTEEKNDKKEETKKEEMKADSKKEIKNETKKESLKNNFCQNCGSKLNKDSKFCPECGKKVN